MDEVVKYQLDRNHNKLTRHPRNVIKSVGSNQSKIRLRALHTCQPEMTKKTEIFVLRCFITPTVPRGFDILVMSHILSYENTLTHNMLRFTAISGGLTTGPLGPGPQAPELQGAPTFSTNKMYRT